MLFFDLLAIYFDKLVDICVKRFGIIEGFVMMFLLTSLWWVVAKRDDRGRHSTSKTSEPLRLLCSLRNTDPIEL